MEARRPRVVIVGAGFGGLAAAKALKRAPVEMVLIDRENYHLFQPLIYQVAMAQLAATEVSASIRSIVARQRNTRVLLGEVTGIDVDRRHVTTQDETLDYDYLVVAGGARPNYFGKDAEWARLAPSPKGIDAAHEIRRRVLFAFEEAEALETDSSLRRRLLEFVVVGGGPTGVEFAGALAELSRRGLARDFRRIDPSTAKVHIIEGGPLLLAGFPEDLSRRAAEQLSDLGVIIHTGQRVMDIDANGVTMGSGERVDASTVIWAAGVQPVALAAMLPGKHEHHGQVAVERDLSLPGHPEVFVIGDMAYLEQDGKALPGLSPVAMQEGRAVARSIEHDLQSKPREPFRYFDKGMLATIGRSRAVGVVGRVHFSGLIAWLVWAFVHIFYLISFRNRLFVALQWASSYLADDHAARIIFGLRHPLPSLQQRLHASDPSPPALPS